MKIQKFEIRISKFETNPKYEFSKQRYFNCLEHLDLEF